MPSASGGPGRGRARRAAEAFTAVALAGVALAAVGCGAPRPRPPPPPPPAPAVAMLDDGLDVPPPTLRVREGHAAGLYYLETVVGAPDLDARLPLVVSLHGLGDRPHVLEQPFRGAPDPVRVVQPRAPVPLGEGFTWLPARVAEGKTALLAAGARASAARLAAFLAEVRATRPTRGLPIVTGFSQGGVLAYALAVLHPEAVGAAYPVAGWLPPPLWPAARPSARLPPIRAMHGTADTVVPFAPAAQAVAHLAALGFDVALVEVPGVGHVQTEAMDARLALWLAYAIRGEWRREGADLLTAPTVRPRPLDRLTNTIADALQAPYTGGPWRSANSKP